MFSLNSSMKGGSKQIGFCSQNLVKQICSKAKVYPASFKPKMHFYSQELKPLKHSDPQNNGNADTTFHFGSGNGATIIYGEHILVLSGF